MTEQPDPVKTPDPIAKKDPIIDESANSTPQSETGNMTTSTSSTPGSKTPTSPLSSATAPEKDEKDSNGKNIEKSKEKSKKKPKEKPKSEIEKLQDEVKKLNEDLDKQQSKYRFLQAELENTRKYYIKQQDSLQLRTKVNTITAFTPLIDAFENAFTTAKKQKLNEIITPECQMDNFMVGFEKLYDMLKGIFKSYQVEAIEKTGIPFNYHFHEVMLKTINDDIPEDTVLNIIQKGYKIKDQVVNPAKVIVSKHSPPPPPPTPPKAEEKTMIEDESERGPSQSPEEKRGKTSTSEKDAPHSL
ncbi:MAG: nucleotide exchange factor GrpE [Promethearchaeota archaeon]|nr:MAG: nucleotide exchange factor GrpE [Candidatus Lokiarchaeota archaeon]